MKLRKGISPSIPDPDFQVERVEVKDVRLPAQLQRAMAAEAEAARVLCGLYCEVLIPAAASIVRTQRDILALLTAEYGFW